MHEGYKYKVNINGFLLIYIRSFTQGQTKHSKIIKIFFYYTTRRIISRKVEK